MECLRKISGCEIKSKGPVFRSWPTSPRDLADDQTKNSRTFSIWLMARRSLESEVLESEVEPWLRSKSLRIFRRGRKQGKRRDWSMKLRLMGFLQKITGYVTNSKEQQCPLWPISRKASDGDQIRNLQTFSIWRTVQSRRHSHICT